MVASLRKPGGLGLQPHQPWPLHARLRSAFSLALRVLIDAERTGVPCRPHFRRGMALTTAPVILAAFCRWPDITWAYPTPYWPGAGKRIPAFAQNTTPFSGSPILPLRLPDSSLSPLDGQCTNRRNSPRLQPSSADLTRPEYGTSC